MLTVLRHSAEPAFTSGCRVATGRSAILHLVRRYDPEYVFMPCYVPDGIIHPVQKAGRRIVFYKLTRGLRPDLGDLAQKLAVSKSIRPLVIGIEYFGLPLNCLSLKKIAEYHSGVVLADCAH